MLFTHAGVSGVCVHTCWRVWSVSYVLASLGYMFTSEHIQDTPVPITETGQVDNFHLKGHILCYAIKTGIYFGDLCAWILTIVISGDRFCFDPPTPPPHPTPAHLPHPLSRTLFSLSGWSSQYCLIRLHSN